PLWLMNPRRADWGTEKLDWGAFVALLLVASTGAATYHFCVLIVAAALVVDVARIGGRGFSALFLLSYGAVCFPFYRFVPYAPRGWLTLAAFPRLYAMLVFWALLLWLLWQAPRRPASRRAAGTRPASA